MQRAMLGKLITTATAVAALCAFAPATAMAADLYRCYNSATGEHLYTTHKEEVVKLYHSGWTWETQQTTELPSDGTPVWRLFDPSNGDHHYTADANEVRVLTTEKGWQYDFDGRPAFYSSDKGNGEPVYRIYNTRAPRFGHLFTSDAHERSVWLNAGGWNDEQVGWYALGHKESAPSEIPEAHDTTAEVWHPGDDRGVDGSVPEPAGAGEMAGTPAPPSDGDAGDAYRDGVERVAADAGSSTNCALVIDASLARMSLATHINGVWKTERVWTVWVGSDGSTLNWIGNYEVQHKDGDAGAGPNVNPWCTVFWGSRVDGTARRAAGGWVHADGTAENGNTMHGGWEPMWGPGAKSWNQNPAERMLTKGGVMEVNAVCHWIYDNVPIGTRVCIVASVL